MDHFIDTETNVSVHVPMRVVQNGEGAEVMVTLYRQPGMDDAKFAIDAEWVKRDLAALKAFMKSR